jgi:Domain of unknown function (DUF4259)
MGAWSHLPFDNDDAADWVSELLEQDSMTMIVDAFCAVTRPTNSEDNEDEYIELPEASTAVAAAQVLRLLTETPSKVVDDETSDELTTEIRDWSQQFEALKPTRKWYAAALEALRASTHKKNSELYEVWYESTEFGPWKKSVDGLSIYFKQQLKRFDSDQ